MKPGTFFLLLVSGLVAHAVLAFRQGAALWSSDHYSYFPLVFIAVMGLIWNRLPSQQFLFTPSFKWRSILMGLLVLGLLTLGIFADSPWFGWLGFLLFLVMVLQILLPKDSYRRVAGAIALLILTVPLPLSIDTALVIELQKFATEQGSLLLDWLGIRHAISGVSIRLPGETFLIDDACSGIHSLFSAITTAFVYSICLKYGVIRTCVTVLQTFYWVIVVNSLRVFLVVFGFVRWNAGLEAGWRHEAIGFASYLLILLLAWSTDNFIKYNWPIKTLDDEDQRRTRRWLPTFAWLDAPFTQRANSVALTLFIACFAILSVGSISQAVQQFNRGGGPTLSQIAVQLSESDLPEEIDGWKRVGFEQVTRERHNVFGTNSLIWTYEKNSVKSYFSIDGSYSEFHDLWYCYSSQGWKLRESDNINLEGVIGQTENPIATELSMYRGDDEQALVFFTCVDAEGQVVPPPAPALSFKRLLGNRLESGGLLASSQTIVPPVFQFQSFVRTDSDLFTSEEAGIADLFAQLRSAAAPLLQSQNPG